jgi:hypothetical protein
MSRYIDADALKAKKRFYSKEQRYVVRMTDIYNAPSIDIVRCKECKHNYNKTLNHGKMYPRCDFTDWKLSENDYCSRGEREGE